MVGQKGCSVLSGLCGPANDAPAHGTTGTCLDPCLGYAGITHHANCAPGCDAGYHLVGERKCTINPNNLLVKFTNTAMCDPDPACRGAGSGLPPHTTKGDCPPSLASGKHCELGCEDGYLPVGPPHRSCLLGNITDIGVCRPSDCVGADGKPDHGTKGDCPTQLDSGHSCHPVCDTGYSLSGVRSCLAGQLTDTARCGPNPCSDADAPPPHGQAGDCPAQLPSGGSCLPNCTSTAPAAFYLSAPRRCVAGQLSGGECIECTNRLCAHNGACVSKAPKGGEGYTCNCTAGWTGSGCNAAGDYCQTSQPCSKVDPGAVCHTDSDVKRGYQCDCSDGYSSSVGEDGANCDVHAKSFTTWDMICVLATVASVAPVPFMVRRYRRSLGSLHDPGLPPGKDAQGKMQPGVRTGYLTGRRV